MSGYIAFTHSLIFAINLSAQSSDYTQIQDDLNKSIALQRVIAAEASADRNTISPTADVVAIDQIYKLDKTTESGPLHYGYAYFNSKTEIILYQNTPPARDYQVGPGDEIVITLWGDVQLRDTHIIDRDGAVFIDKVGLIQVTGLTLDEVQLLLQVQLAKVYTSLSKGSTRKTSLKVSLGQLKSINVHFIGEVNFPGLYTIHPFSTILSGIIQSGGISELGSLRDIRVIRNGKVITSLDFYSFLQSGQQDDIISLKNGDRVQVQMRKSTVRISGAVRRPAIYEMTEGETLYELVEFAGGVAPRATNLLVVERITPLDSRASDDEASTVFTIPFVDAKNETVFDGDRILVDEIYDRSLKITVNGMVKSEGEYPFIEGMTLGDALNLAGGISDKSFRPMIANAEGLIIRRSGENIEPEVIKFDQQSLFNDDATTGLVLHNFDQIVIRENTFYQRQRTVKIVGAVNNPGIYPLLQKNNSLADLLNDAGGLSAEGFEEGIQQYRVRLQSISDRFDLKLRETFLASYS